MENGDVIPYPSLFIFETVWSGFDEIHDTENIDGDAQSHLHDSRGTEHQN